MDFELELVPVPVSDVDCAKTFDADQAGFNVDLDFCHGETFRGVQLTPPGSACAIAIAIAIGVGVVDTAAASIQGLHLVVDDIHAARKELIERGVEVGGPGHDRARQARSLLRALHRPGRQWLDPSESKHSAP